MSHQTAAPHAAASIEGTVSDVRRVVYALRPPALDELGLSGALRQQAAALSSGGLDCTMRERATELGGAFAITAPEGGGALIRVQLPR